jgi:ribose transport system ATP-binding protein
MLLSGDRRRESVFGPLAIRENMTVQVLPRFRRAGIVDRREERRQAVGLAAELAVATPSIEAPVDALSGGNQQKVVMARAFLNRSSVLLVDEPTQGVDAGARPDIYRALRQRCDEGAAVVINSSDAAELAGLCDRVLVLSRGTVVAELSGEELTDETIVGSFVTATSADASRVAEARSRRRSFLQGEAFPLVLVSALITLFALYTNSENSAFLGEPSLRFLLANLLPVALVAGAQLCVLLVAGFDVSVGGAMSVAVVMSSVVIAPETSTVAIALGVVLMLAIGAAIGLFNSLLVVGFGIVPIIATIGTFGILQGVALWVRPVLGEQIDSGWADLWAHRIGVVPTPLIVVVAIFLGADVALHHSRRGLALRAVGYAPESARRLGLGVLRTQVAAYLCSALLATVAGLVLGAQIRNGDPNAGNTFVLTSFAACVLGGASLWGGRGSFLGALLGALLLTEIGKMPNFLDVHPAVGQVVTGALTLVAVLAYAGRDNWLRLKATVAAARRR